MSFNPPPGKGCFTINDFVVDIGDHTVSRGDSVKRIEPKAMHVLYILACDAGDTVERNELLRDVWNGRIVVEEALTRIISQLRQVLDDSKQRRLIQTVPKKGYRLRATVVWQEKPAAPQPSASRPQPEVDSPLPEPPVLSAPSDSRQETPSYKKAPWQHLAMGLLLLLVVTIGVWRYTSTTLPTPQSNQTSSNISVAIMPLRQLSSDESTMYLAEGMTEELIDTLAKSPVLHVPSRYSTLAVNTADKSLPQIAAELDVRYLVEGSVRRINDEFKISVRLIDADSDRVEWSQSYTNTANSLYAIQLDIASAIKRALLPEPSAVQSDEPSRSVNNVEAYQYYLKGSYWLMNGKTSEWFYQSEAALLNAVRLAPQFAAAHGKLAYIYARYHFHDTYLPREEALNKAHNAITKALQQDPTESNALLARTILAIDSGEFSVAERTLDELLSRTPDNATALYIYSELALAKNQFDTALSYAQQAHKHDPLSPWINVNLAIVRFWRGEYASALQAADRAIEIDNSYTWAYVWRAKILHRRGDLTAAIAAMQQSNHIDAASPVNNAYLGLLYMELNQPDEADKWFKQTASLLGDTPDARFWQGFRRFALEQQAPQIAEQLLANLQSLDNAIFTLVPLLYDNYLQVGNIADAREFFLSQLQHGPAPLVNIKNRHLAAAFSALPNATATQLAWQDALRHFANVAPVAAQQGEIYWRLRGANEPSIPLANASDKTVWLDYQWLLTTPNKSLTVN